jgi:hypothetical protein
LIVSDWKYYLLYDSIFFELLLLSSSIFNDEILLANEIKFISLRSVSGEDISPSYDAVQQRQATRQRTILKYAFLKQKKDFVF